VARAFDLAVAWSWEYDAAFIEIVRASCSARGLSLLEVTPASLHPVLEGLHRQELGFRVLLDRAGDADPAFHPLGEWARWHGARILNDLPIAERAWDKATMHLEFIAAGLHTPHTLVLAPFAVEPDLPTPDLTPLGTRFILKPAHGGGGVGVRLNLSTWDEIQRIRRRHPEDKYLAQEWVTATLTHHGPAWFRVIYALGEVLPFWWGVASHVYAPLTLPQEATHGITKLRETVLRIAAVCGLDVFSTEIACRHGDGELVSVDYVNDPVDLRPQSQAIDGVPDAAIHTLAARLADAAAEAAAAGRAL
jgi:hypothetical protein